MVKEKNRRHLSIQPKYSTNLNLTRAKPKIDNEAENKIYRRFFPLSNPCRKGEGGLRTKGFFKNSLKEKPLVSIVTVVFNEVKHLEQAIESVIYQTYDNIEYIVIDAGSEDGTLDIIKKYENQIDYWVSESDKGIYDGMNKGISLTTGELIGILNSNDWYEKNSINKVITEYKKTPTPSIFYGDIKKYTAHGRLIRIIPSLYPKVSFIYGCSVAHPSCFTDIRVYQKIGLFDFSFDITADYEFFLRAWKARINFCHINEVLTNFRSGGISSNFIGSAIQSHKARLSNNINWVQSFASLIRLFFIHYTKELLKLFGLTNIRS
jgi:glycosyltransferase involved in cell wall biosynthesis